MALSVGNSLTDDDSTGITQVLSVPTGGGAGDLLVAAIFFGDNDSTDITAPGWQTDVYDEGSTGADRACAILTKQHEGGSEPSTHTFTAAGAPGNARIGGIIVVVKGAKTSGWIDNVDSVSNEANTASPTGATPTATTTNNIEFLAYASHAAKGTGSATPPSGYTIVDGDAFGIGASLLGLLYRINSTTGAKGGAVWDDLSDSALNDWTHAAVVIGEAAAGGATNRLLLINPPGLDGGFGAGELSL